jgi:hypothetical protein
MARAPHRCAGPGPCQHKARAHGLCTGHLAQVDAGRPLAPLRQLADVRREVISMRVSPECRAAVAAKPAAARFVLEHWARGPATEPARPAVRRKRGGGR